MPVITRSQAKNIQKITDAKTLSNLKKVNENMEFINKVLLLESAATLLNTPMTLSVNGSTTGLKQALEKLTFCEEQLTQYILNNEKDEAINQLLEKMTYCKQRLAHYISNNLKPSVWKKVFRQDLSR
jgi:hypothetical protein